MSEPLSNHEIEDVLSSIRRLVSAEPRTRTRDLGSDKLLLTPALRVVPDVQPEPLVLAAAVQEPQAPVAEVVAGPEIRLAALEAEVAALPEAVVTDVPDTGMEQVSDPVSDPLAALDTGSTASAEPLAAASAEPDSQMVAEAAVEPVAEPAVEPGAEPEVAEAVTGHDAPYEPQAGVEQAANLASSPVRAAATLHLIDAEWEDEIWEEPEPTLAELAEEVEDAELVADAADGMADAQMSPAMHNSEQPVPFFARPRSRTPADLGPVSDGRAEEPAIAAVAVAEPVVAEAVSAEAVSAEAVSAEAVSAEAVVAEAVSAEPVVAEAVSAGLEIPEPVMSEPIMPEPVSAEPVSAESVSAEPVSAEPVSAEPVSAEPVSAEPVSAEPVSAEPVRAEPVSAEPVRAEPLSAEPVIAEPASAGLAVLAPEPVPQAFASGPAFASDSAFASDPAFASDEMALALQAEEAEGTDLEPGYAMVDEDVLNEIVRDLIREELQGALGERITRNVRKLVRAEINRALASRPYE